MLDHCWPELLTTGYPPLEAHYELACAELLETLVQQCKETSQLNIYQKKLKIITEP